MVFFSIQLWSISSIDDSAINQTAENGLKLLRIYSNIYVIT